MTQTLKTTIVSYEYILSGDIEIDLNDYERYCAENGLKTVDGDGINVESLKEYMLENINLVETANDGKLSWVEE